MGIFLSDLWRWITHQPDQRRVPLNIKDSDKPNTGSYIKKRRLNRRIIMRRNAHNRLSTIARNGPWRG